jgi:hypothetical protein
VEVIDVSSWAVIRDEPGGRDPNKRWLAVEADHPRDQHWLWKSRQRTGDGSGHALTDCAEVVVSRLAKTLRVPAAECEFAECDGEPGVISRNVSPHGFSLNTGATYLPEVEGYERRGLGPADGRGGRMHRERGYTLDAVGQVLAEVAPPRGVDGLGAFAVFAGYLVLDALVANTDRHPGNWALLERDEDGQRFLAPTYDHGSALGAGLTDRNRELTDPMRFAAKGKANPFGNPAPLRVDLAHEAVRRAGASVWLRRVDALEGRVLRAILTVPDGRMSDVAARFMERVVLENRKRLCDVDSAQD